MDVFDSNYADWYASGWKNAIPREGRFNDVDSFIRQLLIDYDRRLHVLAAENFSGLTHSELLSTGAIDIAQKVSPYEALRLSSYMPTMTHGHTAKYVRYLRIAAYALISSKCGTAEEVIDNLNSDMIEYVKDVLDKEIGKL